MKNYKKDFPLLSKNKITYLDSGATTQKPKIVLQKLQEFYHKYNANTNRGVYKLAEDATKEYEQARQKVADFIGAENSSQIIFTKNATEAINLVAYSYGLSTLKKGDKIVISIAEHHSNLVPWQMVAKRTGAKLEYLYLDKNTYQIPKSELAKIDKNTKIVAITMASNVIGAHSNIKPIIKQAHSVSAVVLVDGAQAVAHEQINISKLDADFFVFSGHKMYAPLGIGVLAGKQELLNKMPPFLMGGAMIDAVEEQSTTFAEAPHKFEAGTQNVAGAVGLGYAIDYIKSIGHKTIQEHEKELMQYAISKLEQLPYITLYLPSKSANLSSLISFNINGIHSHDAASMLNNYGVCVRSGHHCTAPLHAYLGINSTLRASFGIYNTKKDVDTLVAAIQKTYQKFKKYIGE